MVSNEKIYKIAKGLYEYMDVRGLDSPTSVVSLFKNNKSQYTEYLKNFPPETVLKVMIAFWGISRGMSLQEIEFMYEDLLSDLDYTTVNHDYTFNEVFQRIINYGTDWDVCYPLITSNRIWEYLSTAPVANVPNWLIPFLGSNSNDIHTNAGAINYTELFPALRVKSIFDIIGLQYGVTFNGAFLTDPKFTQAYIRYTSARFPSDKRDEVA